MRRSWTRRPWRHAASSRCRPLLDAVASLRDVRDLAAFLGEFEQIGGSGVFGVYVDVDGKNSDRTLFNVVQGGLGLPDESYYHDEKFAEIREKYAAFLTRMFELVGHDDPADAAATVVAVETRLSQGHWERAETRDVQKTYNLLTVEELHALCPAFDWEAFIRNLGGSEETIAETCIRQPSYLEHLSSALEEVPIEDWRAWLVARVIRAYAPYLTRELVETNFDFYGRTLGGTPELRERWKRGVALVEGSIGEAVGREYVARHFPPDSKAMMEDLVGNLLRAYRQSISALDWMSDETKQAAYDKLDRFRSKIGYPEKFRDYSSLDFVPDDLLGNVAAANAVRDPPAAGEDRLAGRPRRVADAAADRERLLPARHERDLLPGRDPAEAVLLARRRAGRELRRHRGRDRPRDRARLRRPGLAVRRHRQPARLVDPGRQGGVPGQGAGPDRAVQRVLPAQPARRARERRAHGRREHRRPRWSHDRAHGVLDLDRAATSVSRTPRPSSSTGPTAGAPSGGASSTSSTSPSTRTARRSSAPTSCATSTSSTPPSGRRRVTGSGSTPRHRVRIW